MTLDFDLVLEHVFDVFFLVLCRKKEACPGLRGWIIQELLMEQELTTFLRLHDQLDTSGTANKSFPWRALDRSRLKVFTGESKLQWLITKNKRVISTNAGTSNDSQIN